MTNKIYDKTSFLKRFVLLLMLFARVTGIWADDFTGIWYIDNNENHTGAANQRWYLVPAANPQQANAIDAYYSPNHNETNGDPAKPFLTTYKTNKDLNSVWVVAPSSTSGYYYVVHVLTGKYVIYEPPLPNDGSNQRKSMHLQNISDTGYALNDKDDYNFDFIGAVDDNINIRPKSCTGWFWNPAGTQTNQYYGNGSPLYRNGLVGIYNNATGNSIWHFESALLAAPTISDVDEYGKVTVTENNGLPAGYNVRYTFGDGTQADPTASSATMPADGYEVLAAGTIKVVIERYGVVLTAVASKHVEPMGTPDDPVITLDDCTNTFTIDAGGAGIYYTTDGTEPSRTNGTHYTGPFQLSTSVTAVKAVSYFGNTRSVSVTTSAAFTPKTLMPTINVVGNRVTITSASGNIYYTLDDATPTERSTPYTSSFTLPNGTGSITIKAIAKEAGMSASCVSQREVKLAIFISNITELNGITAADNCILTCDLDASGYTGSIDNFSGSFDGGMFTISGLTHPLFNTVNGGTVKNVRLSGVSISGLANAGAVCGEADGATKIYNCGVLSGSVSGTSNAGGLVGHIRSGSSVRVVNCYNYASVSGGSYAAGIVGYNEGTVGDVRIALCMMYGSVSGDTNISPVYAGNHTSNVRNFTEYNYWRSKANISYTAYNDQLAIDKDEYLTRFPFYRHILNTHRELAAFFLFGESGEDVNDIIAEEVAEIGHWVLDTEVADYPIVEDWQSNTRKVLDAPAGTTVTDEHLGTSLNVSVKINGRSYSASLPITDMDEANHDYTYGKVVLPFANEFEVNTDYTKICTGWRITHIEGGKAGTFSNYNVSDRNCTAKDLYSTTGFVFAQGGYFIVPYDVTNIEITANFANAYYLCDASYEIGYSGDGSQTGYTGRTGLGGSTPTTYHEQPVYNTLPAALNAMSASNTTHTQAVVLVGNYHMDNDNLSDKTANGYTIMSIDADNNQEPDYAIYSNNTQDRPAIPPTRFDFVAFIPMGMSSHVNGAKFYPNTPIWKSRGWFEITETGLMRADQFELESGNFNENKTNNCRCIINGGYFTQMVRSRDKACTRLSYYQIGGKAYVKEFYPGNHSAKSYENTLVPVNVTGGEIEQCFMTGYGKGTVTGSDIYFWCAGGKIHKFLGAYMENPSTAGVNMTAKIDHARIYRFFGGGTTSKARITGNINVTIDNSLVDFYCGGPEFGDMVTGENGKTVTTHATNTTFGEYYGAGFGGTAITYTNDEDESKNLTATYTYPSDFFTNHYLDAASDAGRLDYKSGYGIGNCYKFEFIIHSRGHQSVARFYTGYASFSLAKTGNVTNVLDNCTILNSFYGGGCQGTVDGTVTSTLNGCTVVHSAYGGGYKAAANEVDVYPTTSPSLSVFKAETGIFSDFGTVDPEPYTWEQGTAAQNNVADATNKKLYTSTEVTMADLGNVTGAISITVNGGTVGESVYAGGNESKSFSDVTVNFIKGSATNVYGGGNVADVDGSSEVNVTGGTVSQDVYGGGKGETTVVGGDVTVNIGTKTDGTPATYRGTGSVRNVYGGSALGAVNATKGDGGTLSATAGSKTTSVNVYAGTVSGSVFGGGLGQLASGTPGEPGYEAAIAAQNFGNTSITVENTDNTKAQVQTAVYGGANVNGVLMSDAEVTISGGTVGTTREGNTVKDVVFGGGQGQPTLVNGNVTVNVGTKSGDATPVYGGTAMIHGNVYGGSALGNTNAAKNTGEDAETNPLTFYTTGEGKKVTAVNLYGGTVAGNVFGGGLGQKAVAGAEAVGTEGDPDYVPAVEAVADVESFVGGDVTVELYGAVLAAAFTGGGEPLTGQIFGANNWNGTPKGHVLVHVYKTAGNGSTNVRTAAGKLASSTAADHTYELLAVYGGGNQAAYVPTAADGFSEVIIDGDGQSSIKYVYGGGNVATVPETRVTLNGSYEVGSIFGGGNQAGVTRTTLVNVNGGRITDGVYGGCNSSGNVTGLATVNILGGTPGVAGCPLTNGIFGGGYGQATTTSGNVTVNVGNASAETAAACPTVYGDIYGGSALGTVNDAVADLTTVNINNGTVHGNIYGGGLGAATKLANGYLDETKPKTEAIVNGTVHVKIGTETQASNFVTIDGQVFGCNNLAGTPKGLVYVDVYKTAHTEANDYPSPEPASAAEVLSQPSTAFAISAVYGGGNLADYKTDTENAATYVRIHGCDNTIEYVYGGGNAASSPATNVIIEGGRFNYIFGGGNGAGEGNPGANIEHDANVTITGGLVYRAFGGSNTKGLIGGTSSVELPDVTTCTRMIHELFGGGNEAPGGSVDITIPCGTSGASIVYGGANNADMGTEADFNAGHPVLVKLTVEGGDFSQVFGGNNQGGTIWGDVELYLKGGTIANAYGGNNLGGDIKGTIKVFVVDDENKTCPLVLTNVYGGGYNAAYAPADPTITSPIVYVNHIKSGNKILGNVFGGGYGTPATVTANPKVIIGDTEEGYEAKIATIAGNVYGGGELAKVVGSTEVLIQKDNSVIEGTVYGGGKGSETDIADGQVTVNTKVELQKGHVHHSIYGGGELGSVGTFTEYYTAENKGNLHVEGEPKTCKAGTGLTEVIVSGGKVGLDELLMPDPDDPISADDYGYIFCAGRGLSSGEAIADKLAVSDHSYLEISGTALITGSVYGGSENGQVLNDTHVKIAGGQIGTGYDSANNTWDGVYTEEKWTAAIAKVKAGTFTDADADAASFHECDAWPFGAEGQRYIYDPYADTDGYNSQGGSKSAGNGHSFYGNVFGGGSGFYPYAPGQWRRSAGRVCGNTHVEITGGHILTNVYGGNEITDVLGKSTVEMKGGTLGVPRSHASIEAHPVNCYIFGGGMGDPRPMFNGWSNVGSSEVIVSDNAVVFGSVFGGGEDGHVLGNAQTTIKGNAHIGTFGDSSVDGNIFGSGRGFSALALTAGVVCGNVIVNIQDQAKLLGSVFGGGRLAAVGTHLAAEDDANYGVLIPEGQDPYGTGSTKHGNVIVNITGGTIGNQSQMNASQYSIGDVFGGSKGAVMEESAKSQKLGLVKNTQVNISQAEGKTTTIYGNVYGGGEIASVGSYTYATEEQADEFNAAHAPEKMSAGDVYDMRDENTGLAEINITGGTIGQNSLSDTNGSVFGGCLGKSGTEYSGYSFVQNAKVNISQAKGSTTTIYGCVFGGGENGHVYKDTDVKIMSGTIGIRLDNVDLSSTSTITDAEKDNMIYRGNVYGGGRGVDKTSLGDYSLTAGKVNGNTNVTVEGGTIYRCVYGGGSLASVGKRNEPASDKTNGKATVTIKGGTIGTDGGAASNDYTTLIPTRTAEKENGYVYGSGRGMAAGHEANATVVNMAFTRFTEVNIEDGATVTGSVFGGGENGHVKYDTKVTMSGGTVGTELTEDEHAIDDNGRGRLIYRANVYGGGRGLDTGGDDNYSLTAGRVYGNTYVKVSGGKIYHDVFGGGSLASVGNETVNTTTGEVTYGDNSGNTEVHISGGIIGCSETHPELQGFNCGFVYGGCRGLAADPSSDIVKMAYVHGAKVYIEPGANIKGSVFGGGANGHVKNNTYVEISGGSIGTALTKDEVGFDDHGVAKKPVFRGNVYAGGRGVDMYQKSSTESYSMTAGAVYGNAELKMTGGHVWHNVYGSGAMASVGTVTAKPAGTHVHDEIVDEDDNIVNPDGSEVTYLTGVFKENTGKVTVTITGGTVGDTTPGHEGRNNGRVYGAGRGVSANRSDLVASMEYVNDTYVTIGTSGQKPSEYSGTKPGTLNYPYIYGAVFGGGENGHVKNDTHVTMHSGIIGWPLDQGATGQHLTSADGASKNPYRGHIFGGGRGVDPLYHTSSETRSSTAGRVYGHTYVTMTGGLVRRAIYGGGLLASVGMYKLAQSDLHIIDMIEDQDKVDGGDTYIEISGGIIGNVMPDGSAITDASTSGFALLAPGDNNGQVFGSSCGMVADNYIQGGVAVDQQYRQMGYSHSTHVNISGGHLFGSVFGSGENGHVWEDTRINVSGGEIGSETSTLIYCGNVYGSGRGVDHPHAHVSETAGKVRGNTTVNVTGGIVWRDVYGGGSLASVGEATEKADNSKKEVTTDPTTNNPFPYSTGLTRVVIDGTSKVYGSVYGSGRGVASSNTEYRQAAYVKNTLVTVQGTAHVYQNVFGGGNAGHVRKNTDVTISGSAKVDGNVYGGGAGSVKSPTAGLVNHDVTVNIKGGLVGGDVYGGGAIANTNVHDVRNDQTLYPDKASIYGTCSETTRVHCKTDVNLTGGIILGNAYGGGEGVILGADAPAADIANAGALVRGDVTVTLDGTAFWDNTTWDDEGSDIAAMGRVFGCNNLNGTPQGTVLVKVLQTKGVTKSGDTYTVNTDKPTKDTKTYELEGVYGGGNLAAYDPWDAEATGQYSTGVVAAKNPLQVVIDGCDLTSIAYVYGGGNAAAAPSTQVVVKGSYELGTVFGGGNGYDNYQLSDGKWYENPGANVGYKNYAHYVKVGETGYDANTHGKGTEADPYKAIENDNASTKEYRIANYSYGSGDANVYLFGGYIHDAFGGSNTKGDIAGKTEIHVNEVKDGEGTPVCPLILDELYGGGNEAYMEGGTDIDMGCITRLKALYGGAKNADVDGDINLTITSGHFDRVFGGNNLGGTISGAITVNIEETGCNPITIGELYGCGNQAAYSVENIDQVTHTSLDFSDPTAANYYKNFPKVNVKSFTSIGRVFGGGLGVSAIVTGNPTVNINEIVGEGANNMNWTYHQTTKTEGEQTVPDAGKTITYSDGTSVTMPTHEEGKIGAIGTVFGGGNAAKVVGDTNVMIGTEKTIKYTSDAADAADRTVVGVDIRDNVFGGGNQAEVTGNTNVEVGPEKE